MIYNPSVDIRCNQCYWLGTEESLVKFNDEDGPGHGCPNCKTDEYLMDLEEGEKLW